MSLFRVSVTVAPLEPFGFVQDLGQDQCRLDRVKRLALVENFVVGIGAAAKKVGNHVSGALLGDDSCSQRIAGAVDRNQLDLGKLFAKLIEQRLGAITANVKV